MTEVESDLEKAAEIVIPPHIDELMERLLPNLEYRPEAEVERGQESVTEDEIYRTEQMLDAVMERHISLEAKARGSWVPGTTMCIYFIKVKVFPQHLEFRFEMGSRLLSQYSKWFELVRTGQVDILADKRLRQHPEVLYDLRDYWLSKNFNTEDIGPCYLGMQQGVLPHDSLKLRPRARVFALLMRKVVTCDGIIQWDFGGRVGITTAGAIRHMGVDLEQESRWLRISDLDGNTFYNGAINVNSTVGNVLKMANEGFTISREH